MIKAKRIYEPKKDDNFDIQKVLGEAIQKSITSSTDQTKQLVSEFERMSSDAGVKKLEEKFYQYIKNLRIEKEEIKQDIYKSIEDWVSKIGERVENHKHQEYLTQDDKDECINSARDMVNEAVLNFDNLFKPFLEQLDTKSDKEHTHMEFEELKGEIEENEEELERKLEKKAEQQHKHEVEDITGLSATLKGFAKTDHKHDEYATREELDFINRRRSGGGGAHVIQDSGVVKAQRGNLNFIGATVTDDPENNATVVTVTGGGGSGIVETIVAGTGISVDSTDPANPVVSATGGGASSLEVTQTAHGFIDLDWLYFDDGDSTFKKAQSDAEATLGMWHVVEVVDANTFKTAKDGVHPIANALTVGEYVLSPTTAGAYTQTIPGTLGEFILYGMEVVSTTEISFYTVPAIVVGTQIEGSGTTDEVTYWVNANTLGSVSGITASELTTVVTNTSGTNTGDVTVLDSTEIDFTLAGQQITASLIAGSIDESKLDASVNASLDLADGALPSSYLDTDGTLSANSDAKVPSQKAVKTYVDAIAQGLSIKESVRLATTGPLDANTYNNGASGVGATLTGVATGVLTIDSVAVALNDRILVKDEVTGANNGIYFCSLAGALGVAYVLTRSTSFDTGTEISGGFTFVEEGTANADNGYVCTTNDPITVGTTAIAFTQFSGAGQIVAGNALTKTGNTLDVAVDGVTIEVNADALRRMALTGAITAPAGSGTTSLGSFTTAQLNTALSDNDIATGGGTATGTNTGDVTVLDSSEIDFTLTGQQITASLIAGSIDETKLDASTNASLDLADSSVQHLNGLSIDNTIARFHSTTGKVIQGSGASIDDSGNISANNISGTNTGDQTSIVGITGTLAEFNTAITDANIVPEAGGTFTGDISVPAETYGAGRNGSNEVPTKNDLYDKIETLAGVSDGDKGDITVSSSGTVWTVDNDAITYAKMQNVSATDKLLGRSTAGAGDVEEITCTSAGRAILDDADATAQRATLGVGNTVPIGNPFLNNYVLSTYKTVLYASTNLATATGAYTVNRLYYIPFYAFKDITVSEVGCTITSGNAAGKFRVGIYDTSSGRPNTLLVDSGDISTAATGYISAAISQSLTAGNVYWLAVSSNLGAIFRFIALGGAYNFLGFLSTSTTACSHYYEALTGGWSALPGTSGTLTTGTGNVPAVYSLFT